MGAASATSLTSLPPRVRGAVTTFAERLHARYGERVLALRRFGSYARGTAHGESDVDVAVVLDVAEWRTRGDVINIAADIGLESLLDLSPTVFDRATYERFRNQERPLVADIEREGIAL